MWPSIDGWGPGPGRVSVGRRLHSVTAKEFSGVQGQPVSRRARSVLYNNPVNHFAPASGRQIELEVEQYR
jgi:hypothetical protein